MGAKRAHPCANKFDDDNDDDDGELDFEDDHAHGGTRATRDKNYEAKLMQQLDAESSAGEEDDDDDDDDDGTTKAQLRRITAAPRTQSTWKRRNDIPPSAEMPDALSLGMILSQALTAKDSQLLDDILGRSVDLLVIRRSLLDLETSHVPAFMHELTQRVLRCNAHVLQLGPWIRELLRQHAGYFVGTLSQNKDFGVLHAHASARLRVVPSVLQLLGRVEATVNRRLEAAEVEASAETADDKQKPLLHFVEEEVA